jgi:predicted TIM-barrel fold metal-dependent hydrolase
MNWLGADNCMWSIDYPHPESTYGESGSVAQSVYEALGPADAKKVLGGNAARLYGF